ncbi:MAG TPA: CAP domain-containing protein [Ktedonosporobacter sp.]|nr:CAP domain-containing protein [Ktedonosporobacter sp.]
MGRRVLLVVFCSVQFVLLWGLSACASPPTGRQQAAAQSASNNHSQAIAAPLSVPRHEVTPVAHPTTKAGSHTVNSGSNATTGLKGSNATGNAAPYGQAPALSDEEGQLTQRLFDVINSDRAARGLYPYTWSQTLAAGARLHSWNMYHCGFSHTCPDGRPQCQRIANEGFAGYADCGENIAYAGPYPTAWDGVHTIQESMINEPPSGWHRIHLTSATLQRVGVGVYVDPTGYIWFTEDFVG